MAQRGLFIAALWLCAVRASALSAVGQSPLVNGPDLQLPSIGRVLFAFILVGAIALVAIFALKRIKPWLLRRGIGAPVASEVALISHRKLSRTLNVYVVDAERQRFMIVQSPHSTVVTRLSGARTETDLTAIGDTGQLGA